MESCAPTCSRETGEIPGNGTKRDDSGFLKESKNYTVAIAYNKGNYMVIGKDEVQSIGKK